MLFGFGVGHPIGRREIRGHVPIIAGCMHMRGQIDVKLIHHRGISRIIDKVHLFIVCLLVVKIGAVILPDI